MNPRPLALRAIAVLAMSMATSAWSPAVPATACEGGNCPCEIDDSWEFENYSGECMDPEGWEGACRGAMEDEHGEHLAQNCEVELDQCTSWGSGSAVAFICSTVSGNG